MSYQIYKKLVEQREDLKAKLRGIEAEISLYTQPQTSINPLNYPSYAMKHTPELWEEYGDQS